MKFSMAAATDRVSANDLLNARFFAKAKKYPVMVNHAWSSEVKYDEVKNLGRETYRVSTAYGRNVIHEGWGFIASVAFWHNQVEVQIAAATEEVGWSKIASVLSQWPAAVYRDDDGRVFMRFWFNSGMGPTSSSRRIAVPEWENISRNYAADLTGLMAREELESARGRLILWHGPPGTGKTYAIRAMARKWAKWAQFEYIVDPDQFFGSGQYMMHVLLNNSENDAHVANGMAPNFNQPWRVLVLEDAGELLEMDAKQRTGQGLSRLLNVSEGLVGQGLKVALLITTNEKLGDLHPAVSRPGRCLAEIEFKPLSRESATEWLGRDVSKGMTLAELYQERDGVELIRPTKKLAMGLAGR